MASREGAVHALNGVSFSVRRGEVLALLGESGSGKSVTLRAILGLNPGRRARVLGSVRLAGKDVNALSGRDRAKMRGTVSAMIFQEPFTALDPVYTVGRQIVETILLRRAVATRRRLAGSR